MVFKFFLNYIPKQIPIVCSKESYSSQVNFCSVNFSCKKLKLFPLLGAVLERFKVKDNVERDELIKDYTTAVRQHFYNSQSTPQHCMNNQCESLVKSRKYNENYNLFNSVTCSSFNNMSKLSVEVAAQLENNAQTAENLVQEIYSKLSAIQTCNPELGVEAQKLIQENNALKAEIEKWKEMLILQQIRNGGNPIIKDPKTLERSAVPVVNFVKQETETETIKPAEVKSEPTTAPAPQGKKGKKGDANVEAKKANKPKETGNTGSTAPQNTQTQGDDVVDVGRLDLRVGLITECTRHPDADSLYIEKINVGEPNVRTVISGLVKHVPIDAMQNRMVIVLCNLKPSKMRGITSEAMVMCASSPDKVEILIPPSGSAPGDVVEVEGYTRRPDAVMNPKKKIFETVAPDLKTNDIKQATFKGVPWNVPGKGFVVSETLCGVNVK